MAAVCGGGEQFELKIKFRFSPAGCAAPPSLHSEPLTVGHRNTRVYSVMLDLITVSSGFYSKESTEHSRKFILVIL